jgi:hypothetical protein
VQTIHLNSPLPAITHNNVHIAGSTEGGYNGAPLVVLDGTNAGLGANGLIVDSSDNVVQGLAIVNFGVRLQNVESGDGIEIAGTRNRIAFNYIGTADGQTAEGNFDGVVIDKGATGNTIGGTTAGAGNTISGNLGASGIVIAGTDNFLQGNKIGTNSAGTAALANPNGVDIAGGSQNTIGGTSVGAGNTISGNLYDGVEFLGGSDTTGNLVQGNLIGTNASGTAAVPNGEVGVFIDGAKGNTIGGTIAGAGNTISGNSQGVHLTAGAAGNLVQGNNITLNAIGVVIIFGSYGNTIGGPGAGNIIESNSNQGVVVGTAASDSSTVGNAILDNSIFANGGLGIDLGADGVTYNGINPRTGPNHFQNYPFLNPYTVAGTLTGTLNSTPNSTFDLQFFANGLTDPSGHGQGEDFLGDLFVTTDALGNAAFTFNYTPILGEPYVTATATDVAGDTSEFSTSVDGVLSPSGLSLAATEGAPLSAGVVVATFTNGGGGSAGASTVDWGDGDGSSYVVTVPDPTLPGRYDVLATKAHPYAEEGSYQVTVTIIDPSTNTRVEAISTALVADAPLTLGSPSLAPVEGTGFAGVVATFLDANPGATQDDFSATILWGDGTSSPAGVSANGSGAWTVNAKHTYAEEGSYSVLVQVADQGTSAGASGTVIVADAPLQVTSQNVSATEGQAVSNVLIATFTDGDTNATAADYSATVAWGDGDGTSAVSIVPDAQVTGQFDVLASKTHAYAEEGNQTISVTIRDAGGSMATALSPATVADALVSASAAVSVTATEASQFTGVVAAFTDGASAGAADDYSAIIAWGDGSSSAGTVAPSGGGFQVLGSHSYSEESGVGSYTVTVKVLDSDGTTVSASGTATVADAALAPLSKTVAFTEGAAGTAVVASFEDADPHGFVSEYSATIAWGDNTTSTGTVTADGVGFDVTGSHAYAEEGSYAVSVTIQDPGGAGATANSTANVADAPLAATGVARFAVVGGQQFTHLMATFTDGDPAGTVNDYSASIAWGDGTTSAGTIGTSASGFTVTGTHTYPAGSGANFVPIVTVKDSGGSMTTAVDSIHDPTRNQLFVVQLYQDLLGRDADAAGLASWSGQLDSGAMTRTQVAGAIAGSMEYRSDEVQALYQHYLHRPADLSGLATFVGFLDSGGTVEQVAAIIVGSPEYYAVRGGNTTTGFLTALYQDALNRLPDAAGAAVFAQALGQGLSRAQLAAAVFGSVEYRQNLVQADYLAWLNRPADPAALNGFTAALAGGLSDGMLAADILGSDEFFSKMGSTIG